MPKAINFAKHAPSGKAKELEDFYNDYLKHHDTMFETKLTNDETKKIDEELKNHTYRMKLKNAKGDTQYKSQLREEAQPWPKMMIDLQDLKTRWEKATIEPEKKSRSRSPELKVEEVHQTRSKSKTRSKTPPRKSRSKTPPQKSRTPERKSRSKTPPQKSRTPERKSRSKTPPQKSRTPERKSRSQTPPQKSRSKTPQRSKTPERNRSKTPQREHKTTGGKAPRLLSAIENKNMDYSRLTKGQEQHVWEDLLIRLASSPTSWPEAKKRYETVEHRLKSTTSKEEPWKAIRKAYERANRLNFRAFHSADISVEQTTEYARAFTFYFLYPGPIPTLTRDQLQTSGKKLPQQTEVEQLVLPRPRSGGVACGFPQESG